MHTVDILSVALVLPYRIVQEALAEIHRSLRAWVVVARLLGLHVPRTVPAAIRKLWDQRSQPRLLREQATRAVRFGGAGAITALLSWRPTVFQRYCRAEYSCCRLNKRMSS